jgi:hypothetical protein
VRAGKHSATDIVAIWSKPKTILKGREVANPLGVEDIGRMLPTVFRDRRPGLGRYLRRVGASPVAASSDFPEGDYY